LPQFPQRNARVPLVITWRLPQNGQFTRALGIKAILAQNRSAAEQMIVIIPAGKMKKLAANDARPTGIRSAADTTTEAARSLLNTAGAGISREGVSRAMEGVLA